MAFRTVLTYGGSDASEHRLSAAVELARYMDANLVALAFGLEPDVACVAG